MRIDEGRRDEIAGGVDDAAGLGVEIDGSIAAIVSPVMPMSAARAVGQGAALDEEVETHLSPFW